MNVPSNLKYSNDHEWCRMEGDTAYVGITDFAQSQLGDIVFVDVPTEGETVAAGEVFGTIEAVKTVSDAFLPVSGEIVEFNAAVDADPSIVNKDPYGEGWLVKVRVSDPAEYDTLLTAERGGGSDLRYERVFTIGPPSRGGNPRGFRREGRLQAVGNM